jgi:hypothetical protein
VRRFRPNIVVATAPDHEGFVENDWIGRTLAIGDEVRLRITGPCPRCVMTTLPQGDLPKDAGILRTAAQNNEAMSVSMPTSSKAAQSAAATTLPSPEPAPRSRPPPLQGGDLVQRVAAHGRRPAYHERLRQPVAADGNGFSLVQAVFAASASRTFATGCAPLFLAVPSQSAQNGQFEASVSVGIMAMPPAHRV